MFLVFCWCGMIFIVLLRLFMTFHCYLQFFSLPSKQTRKRTRVEHSRWRESVCESHVINWDVRILRYISRNLLTFMQWVLFWFVGKHRKARQMCTSRIPMWPVAQAQVKQQLVCIEWNNSCLLCLKIIIFIYIYKHSAFSVVIYIKNALRCITVSTKMADRKP